MNNVSVADKIDVISKKIREYDGDAWLFYDFHNRDEIAYNILELDFYKKASRRWFYSINANGEHAKIVSAVESGKLDSLPGKTYIYKSLEQMIEYLQIALTGCKKVFMQYSPMANVPSISVVDAGTVELIKSFDKDILSSANLVQQFEAKITEAGFNLHKEAGNKIQCIKNEAFKYIFDKIRNNEVVTEYEVKCLILNRFEEENLICDGNSLIVAANEHAADPHFELDETTSREIKYGDRLLIDMWARVNDPEGIYYDITWCGFAGEEPCEEYLKMFNIVVTARKKAKDFIEEKLKNNEKLCGWEVDKVCREYIIDCGYGDYFVHRTGHSIHKAVHANGVNIDSLETKDDRVIENGFMFSIEPGLYKDEIGVRSEISIYVNDNKANVVGDEQEALLTFNDF